jgi:DNA polymerase/3'-5' exonuclease PolX
MTLVEALPLAEGLVEHVRCVTVRCEVAGSIRRHKETVKDVELVAIVEDYEGLYRRLADCGRFIKPGVPDVVDWPAKPGAKYVRMLLNEGIKLDIFVATPDNWGGIFTMRTGSGAGPDGNPYTGFVPMMFARWKRVSKGGRMVGGQPTLPDGTSLAVPEEDDFFRLCEAQWVPPQDRVSKDAIHALKKDR